MGDLAGKVVLVTGATGFVGGALCERLSAEGAQVRALARRTGRDGRIRGLAGVGIVQGDICDAGRMYEVMQGVDMVYHVAAALAGSLAHQRAVNVEGTRNVMMGAMQVGVGRVVHVSSVAVMGYDHAEGVVTEGGAPSPSEEAYSLSKAEAEAVVREIGDAHALPYCIVRPGGIYGAHSGMWTDTMFKLAGRWVTVMVGDGRGYVPLIHIDDLVDLLILAGERSEAIGEAFTGCYDPPYTWRRYLGAFATLRGHGRWLGVPIWLVRAGLHVVAKVAPRYSQASVAPEAMGFLTKQVRFEARQAQTLMGWQAKVGLEDGIRGCEGYLRERGLLK